MIHLPLYIEKKLKELYPKQKDRDDFVKEVVKKALEDIHVQAEQKHTEQLQMNVGGQLHLFTDGGSRGNPGQAAIGCVITEPSSGVVLKEHSEAIGTETNNIAEYKALIRGLQLVQELNPNSVLCHLDSELVVKQVIGQYKVKMAHLQPLVQEARTLAAAIGTVEFKYIPRAQNSAADALVNRALDSLPKPSYV